MSTTASIPCPFNKPKNLSVEWLEWPIVNTGFVAGPWFSITIPLVSRNTANGTEHNPEVAFSPDRLSPASGVVFDLAAGYPPAVIHREYFHTLGAFRAGPPVPEFEELMARSVVETDAQNLTELGKQIDRLVYDDALSIFLCCPMALVAVNRYVKFTGHAATLELAETEVAEEYCSRR